MVSPTPSTSVNPPLSYAERAKKAQNIKPRGPSQHVVPSNVSIAFGTEEDCAKPEKRETDPFAPPYVPNLHLGELKDTEEDAEYACKIMNQIKLWGKPIRVNKVRLLSAYFSHDLALYSGYVGLFRQKTT